MEKFLAAVRNMFSVPDLRRRILFTLGCWPYIDWAPKLARRGSTERDLSRYGRTLPERLLGVLDLFSGETSAPYRSSPSVLRPYITASIILQLMTVVSAVTKEAPGEGEMGRQKDQPVDQVPDCWSRRDSNFIRSSLAAS